MPTSRPEPIPFIVNKIITLKPRSLLDVGIGFGKWGFLAREYTDIWLNHLNDVEGFKKSNWKSIVDGIEVFGEYVEELQRGIYDNIWIGDACELIPTNRKRYDMIIASDVLEHMSLDKGSELLASIKDKCKNAFIVTPARMLPQGAVYNNQNETHVHGWIKEQLENWGTVTVAGGAHILEIHNDT